MLAQAAAGSSAEKSTVLHSWCVQTQWDAPTVDRRRRARGCSAPTAASILDMSSLAECSNLGHQHPHVVAAIRAQAAAAVLRHQRLGRGAARASSPRCCWSSAGFGGGRVFFTLGGADANEHAVKFARQAAGKPRGWIITRERSYHGASYAAMALSGDTRTAAQIDPAVFHVRHVPPPYSYRCPFGTADAAACGTAAAARIAGLIARARRGARSRRC